MDVAGASITAGVALVGVLLGGWLSIRNQERLWQRDHARQWRDIRLSTYRDFVAAYRQYVAFALEPTANISAVPHERQGDSTPFFDHSGRPYKEQLDGAATAVRLVSESLDTLHAAREVVRAARQIAAARATHSETAIPRDVFQRLWTAQHSFLLTVRKELGLVFMPVGTDDA
ncbi:hypothetical protein ACJWDR_00210 [Streptomyces tauricus]|uniref:hypothetical protein n=1 Tax=Streptomyces tauricus TaxID=68274 RepID=UPI00387F1BC2